MTWTNFKKRQLQINVRCGKMDIDGIRGIPQLKMAFLRYCWSKNREITEVLKKSVPILVEMRDQTPGGVPLTRQHIFLIFNHFCHFLAKNGWFFEFCCSQTYLIMQFLKEMYQFWSNWGVKQLLEVYHWPDSVFSFIFSHFSQFLAKNGWFFGYCWSQTC